MPTLAEAIQAAKDLMAQSTATGKIVVSTYGELKTTSTDPKITLVQK